MIKSRVKHQRQRWDTAIHCGSAWSVSKQAIIIFDIANDGQEGRVGPTIVTAMVSLYIIQIHRFYSLNIIFNCIQIAKGIFQKAGRSYGTKAEPLFKLVPSTRDREAQRHIGINGK